MAVPATVLELASTFSVNEFILGILTLASLSVGTWIVYRGIRLIFSAFLKL